MGAIRGRLAALDSNYAVTWVRAMDEVVDASEGQRRSMLILLGLFAAAGLLLAAIGVYAMGACCISGRAAELSVRAAAGASPAAILRLVLRQSLAVTPAGAALGLAGAGQLISPDVAPRKDEEVKYEKGHRR